MPDGAEWLVFLGSAALLAVLPGPGILYVLARSLRGGRTEGVRSVLGNGVGAMAHAVGSALGLSVVLATSAQLFFVIKLLGAGYLIYLGVRALLDRGPGEPADGVRPRTGGGAFGQGVLAELLNPKTAIFFLAFLPHFVDQGGPYTPLVLLLLGTICVLLFMLADVLVALSAGTLSARLAVRPRWRTRQRIASGVTMIGLGGALAVAD